MPPAANQRDFALQVARKLRDAGFESLWAGGCVRDQLLGIAPKDYDVATNATPDQVRELFGRRRTLPIGASFGVITVLGPRDVGQIDVATFRTDASYSDGRHPDSVAFTTAEHDAQRRDFTINGLFYDPIAKQVIDYVGGQQDLDARLIRAIGDPRSRLSEDHLRMLRAIRFAATYNCTIDPGTFTAIQEMAPQITTVSAERIGAELRRMLLDSNRAAALTLLRDSNLLRSIAPEVASLPDELFALKKHHLSQLSVPTLPLVLATLLTNTSSHREPVTICHDLRYTNKEAERVGWLLAHRSSLQNAPSMPWPSLQRLLIHPGITELIAFAEASDSADAAALAFCRERLAWPPERLNPSPLLDGSTLIQHGLSPGPHFSELLERVRDAQLNGEISTRKEALALVDRSRTGE